MALSVEFTIWGYQTLLLVERQWILKVYTTLLKVLKGKIFVW